MAQVIPYAQDYSQARVTYVLLNINNYASERALKRRAIGGLWERCSSEQVPKVR